MVEQYDVLEQQTHRAVPMKSKENEGPKLYVYYGMFLKETKIILYLSRTSTPQHGYNIIESEGTKSVHWHLTSVDI
ncbi:hypothetical protein J6590_023288 [Homalodisca vitripennis]|nr:hypothetical protein J6590_023288 [Homalodisca vitripennis]